MLRICDHPGCRTLTLGAFCIHHEPPVLIERFPRGRPFPSASRKARELTALVPVDVVVEAQALPTPAVSLEGGT
jgi:hypothetical protein